jgi:hypothetical protein
MHAKRAAALASLREPHIVPSIRLTDLGRVLPPIASRDHSAVWPGGIEIAQPGQEALM